MKDGRVVILGNFDGVHIGHQALISAGKRAADRLGCILTAWTFDTIPGKSLGSKNDRERLLTEYGVDKVIFSSFPAVKDVTAEDFVKNILKNELNTAVAVCGYNYSFGAGGRGTPELLTKLCSDNGIDVIVVDKVSKDGKDVSSSAIRDLISEGKAAEAIPLLGRPFFLCGKAAHGAALGRTVGIPTVNFDDLDGLCLPKHGVYATLTETEGKKYVSVTNVGVRPTVNDQRGVTAETHILNFDGDLYGKTVKVEFLSFIREENAFPSLEALSEQIKLDSKTAERIAKDFLRRD